MPEVLGSGCYVSQEEQSWETASNPEVPLSRHVILACFSGYDDGTRAAFLHERLYLPHLLLDQQNPGHFQS